MSPSTLPSFDQSLLRAVEPLVPAAERNEWLRTWHAELWHSRHRRGAHCGRVSSLAFGLIRDALWLRTESWRVFFSGTATLCLAALAASVAVSIVFGLALTGGAHPLALCLGGPLKRFLFAAPLVVFVSFATAPRRPAEQTSRGRARFRIRRQAFFAAKSMLLLLLSFLLSADLYQPMQAFLPNTSDLLQILCFVMFSLVALRWAFADQEQRCKQCLRLLAAPSRVGRPSHNLLEWNGTELVCKQGHGLLSVPEMETSWCQSSAWVGAEMRPAVTS